MNNTDIFLVEYNYDTIEGNGPMRTAALTLSFEEAKRIGETLPKIMGVSPSAVIKQYKELTKNEFMKNYDHFISGYSNHVKEYHLNSDREWKECKVI